MRAAGGIDVRDILRDLQAASIAATEAPYVADAIRLPPGALGRVPVALRDVIVQDEGAQLIARLANAIPGERVLDACASPGNKSLVLAADLARGPASSQLVAADFRASRVEMLARTLRTRAPGAAVVQMDTRVSLPFGEVFDCVLLDAPCSGTVRRDPDFKWTRVAADFPRFAAEQLAMLRAAWRS